MSATEKEPSKRLPSGRHGLPRELVERNQRERLIAAMAEVCAEKGYAGSSVAEVTKRAGVSIASFYRQFKDRRECMLASFEELFERLLDALGGACAGETSPAARVRAAAETTAGLLVADPPAARLLSVEILSVGTDGILAQQDAIEQLALRLRGGAEPALSPRPDAAWAVVAAMVSLTARRVAEGTSPTAAELSALAADL